MCVFCIYKCACLCVYVLGGTVGKYSLELVFLFVCAYSRRCKGLYASMFTCMCVPLHI